MRRRGGQEHELTPGLSIQAASRAILAPAEWRPSLAEGPMPKHPRKLTSANQGYWDRVKRARSWVQLAQELEADDGTATPTDPQQMFVLYWIAFNSMYGRVNETERGRYLRPIDDDAKWFIGQILRLDSQGRIRSAIEPESLRKDAENLLSSHFLFDGYWCDGYTGDVRARLGDQAKKAIDTFEEGQLESFLMTLIWGRLRVLRNQIFHGGSTNRDSLNAHTLGPALRIMKALIPTFLDVMEAREDKQTDWPRIPYPRWNSPQHPHPQGPRG